MSEITLSQLTKEVYRYFSHKILKRGWEYYEARLVSDIVEENSTISAYVDGSDLAPYEVYIRLKDFRKSSCDCPYDSYCKHMAAVLFQYADSQGWNARQLLNPGGDAWGKSGVRVQVPEAQEDSFEPAAIDLAPIRPTAVAAAKSRTRVAVPAPSAGGSTEDWHRFFESQFKPQTLTSMKAIGNLYEAVMDKLASYAEDWKPQGQLVYLLHLQLFIMKLTDEVGGMSYQFQNYYHYEMVSHYRSIADQCGDAVLELCRTIEESGAGAKEAGWLDETASFLAEHAFPKQQSYMPWRSVYLLIWWHLLADDDSRIEVEKDRLEQAMQDRALSSSQLDALRMGFILFDIYSANDKQARTKAEQLNRIVPDGFYIFIKSFLDNQQWERLIDWMEWLAPAVHHAHQASFNHYCSLWDEILIHTPVEAQWKRAIFKLLPRSLEYYAGKLLEQERLQEWVDLHIVMDYTPLQFRADYMKPVERQRKDLLLPWYHLSAERLIAEKNRGSYKLAVRLIRKLKQYYKQLKKQEAWEIYHQYLTQHYSRFRAFQEELQKLSKGGEAG